MKNKKLQWVACGNGLPKELRETKHLSPFKALV